MPDDRREAAARWCSIQSAQRRRGTGKGQKEGARLRTVGRDIGGGEKAGAGDGRQIGTTRRKDSACRSGMGAAPRACVYI